MKKLILVLLLIVIVAAVGIGGWFLERGINYWIFYEGRVEKEIQTKIEPLEKRISELESRVEKLEKKK